eukprot:scaffold203619_cov33-Cyclotella_meneghiniana.AAC.1
MTNLIHGMSCKGWARKVLSHESPFMWLAPDLLCHLGAPASSFSFSSFATSVAGEHSSVAQSSASSSLIVTLRLDDSQ